MLHVEHDEVETGVADDLDQIWVVGVHLHAQRRLASLQGRKNLVGSRERFEGMSLSLPPAGAVYRPRLSMTGLIPLPDSMLASASLASSRRYLWLTSLAKGYFERLVCMNWRAL